MISLKNFIQLVPPSNFIEIYLKFDFNGTY